MSLKKKILNSIKQMLNEAEMSEMPPNKTLSKCPANKVQIGEGPDGPICRDKTPAEKAGESIRDEFRPNPFNQSVGVCPPGQEQTGEGPNGPICSPKAGSVAKQRCVLPEIKIIQKYFNFKRLVVSKDDPSKIAGAPENLTTDSILGSKTKQAINWLMSLENFDKRYKPTGCNKQQFATFIKFFPQQYRTEEGIDKAMQIHAAPSKVPSASKDLPQFGQSLNVPQGSGLSLSKESKNWADRTRENASTSLFERLVKDSSSKKVI